MKKKMFLWFMPLVGILMSFSIQVYAFQDLTRKEAERTYVSPYEQLKSPIPVYLYFRTGKFSSGPLFSVWESDENMYIKLQQLKLIEFKKTKGKEYPYHAYEVEIRDEGKGDLIEVQKEEIEKFELPKVKWYKIKIFSLKFIGCSGVRNFKEKNEAIADFVFEFVQHAKTFSTIAQALKKVMDVSDERYESNLFAVDIPMRDWLMEVIKDPKTRVTYKAPFDLYDDGWRLRKPEPSKR